MENQYPNMKFSLHFDNFSISVPLFEIIKKTGHSATGTIHSNRVGNCPINNSKLYAKLSRSSEEHYMDKESEVIL